MMIFNYESKKQMKEAEGTALKYTETSMFGNQYKSSGSLVGCNRPYDERGTGTREFFAEVTMKDDVIVGVK
tara:strand:+ start:132 stop:344 length:213 start_codon:yes stop_codon:yes gene_type:complete